MFVLVEILEQLLEQLFQMYCNKVRFRHSCPLQLLVLGMNTLAFNSVSAAVVTGTKQVFQINI